MPNTTVETFKLMPGWVIRSPHFANGSYRPDKHGNRVVAIEPDPPRGDAHDPFRAQALFTVEEIEGSACDHTYGCCYWVDVTVRRLKPDGSNDPHGERIAFSAMIGRTDPLNHVELVGQMSFDGSAATYTLPKP